MDSQPNTEENEQIQPKGNQINRMTYSSADRRREVIYDQLLKEDRVSIVDLQKLLGVSEMTVRRTLQQMADEGILRRVHGGAVREKLWEKERSFSLREVDKLDVKGKLAEAVVARLKNDQTLFLDGGTTCYEIAKRIPVEYNLTVITDSVAILLELRNRSKVNVILLGGQLSADGNTVDGMLASENAEKLGVEWCIFSVGGFSETALGNPGLIGTQTKKIMIRRAMNSLCVADSSKFGRYFIYDLAGWDGIDVFMTDSNLPEEAGRHISKYGTEVITINVDE